MPTKFMDVNHEALTRYLNRMKENSIGIQRILHIFQKLKNEIMYDSIEKSKQFASETLVMGYGNNFNKNNLLCAILQLAGYDCELKYKNVIDNTKWLFSRNGKLIPWYYVSINYFGKILNLDCSFDRNFMSAAKIVYKGDKLDYGLENYYFADGKLFEMLGESSNLETKSVKQEATQLGRGKLCI